MTKRKLLGILPVVACILAIVILIIPVIKNSFQVTGKDPTADFPRISRDTADKAIELFGDDLLIDKFSLNEYTKVNEKYTLIWERSEFENRNHWYELKSTIKYTEDYTAYNGETRSRSHTVVISVGFSERAQKLLSLGYVEYAKGSWKPDEITNTENINGVDVDFNFSGSVAECCFKLKGRTYRVDCHCCCCRNIVLRIVNQILS